MLGAVRIFSKVREWANRDDGRHYRVGNRTLNWIEIVGALLLIGALLLNQIQEVLGINRSWLVIMAIIGFVLLLAGGVKSRHSAGT